MRRRTPEQGYTLVEMLVTMLIFSVVMTLISVSFAKIVKSSGRLSKAAESDIAGLIGLEVMRSDVELAGFGLPWSVPDDINYVEARETDQFVTSCGDGCPEARPSRYNDRPYLDAPPAYRVGDNVGFNDSDYLVLKGTALGTSAVCRSWCYLNYSGAIKPSRVSPELERGSGDRVIVLRNEVFSGGPSRALVTDGSGFTVSFDQALPSAFAPRQKNETHLVYGVAKSFSGAKLSFPFNRSDYYINRKPERMSASCNEGTGILYKTVINHQGDPTRYPLLDCAADMQVVFYFDSNGDGEIDIHPVLARTVPTAQQLREELKEIRIYVLTQQGRRDPAFSYPVATPSRAIVVGDPSKVDELGHVWSDKLLAERFGANWRNYHWKIYTIVVQPKNL